jgi:hypothetical protein
MRAAILVALLAACGPQLQYNDPGPFPFESNDVTALLVGCGQRAAVGSLYCRFQAGTLPTGSVVVVVPPVRCAAESCATVTIWGPDAQTLVERTIPKGQTYVVIPWRSLAGEAFTAAQRGFYPVLVKWTWTDPQTKVELSAAAEGEIRLRVHRAEYSPLTFDPASQTWTWKTGGVTFGATELGRTAVHVD